MKSPVMVLALCALVLFGSSPSFAAVDPAVAIFHKFDNNCAGNDNGGALTYDREEVNFADEMNELRKLDRKCSKGRQYSRSKDEGIKLMLDYIAQDHHTQDCIKGEHSEYSEQERTALFGLIQDPANVAVLASTGYTGDNPEACDYSNFWIYRKSGKLLKFTINHTD